VFTACVFAALVGIFLTARHGTMRGMGGAGHFAGLWPSFRVNVPPSDETAESEELAACEALPMPACTDFQESMDLLNTTRSALLKSVPSGDAVAISAAAKDYEAAVREARYAYTKLKEMTSPQALDNTVEELLFELDLEHLYAHNSRLPELGLGMLDEDGTP
jgi:hypothetical protein